MNKKTAFTVVAKLFLKMGFIREFNVTNAPPAPSGSQVVTA
jgi:hypothetical protein